LSNPRVLRIPEASRPATASRVLHGTALQPNPVQLAGAGDANRSADRTAARHAEASQALSPEAILEAARRDADLLREEAKRQGYAAGLSEGREAAQRELGGCLAEIKKVLAALRESRDAVLDAVVPRVIDAVVRIAGVLAAGEIRRDPERLRAIVQEALSSARDEDRVVVRLHPDDLDMLAPVRQALEDACGQQLVLRADRSLVRGGCLVETSRGLVDARLDARLASIHAALLAGLNGDA
jgi:flagellar assembly protein FliH